MKPPLTSFASLAVLALLGLPLPVWAHVRPDFDEDAKPILSVQPHLIEMVESKYEVEDKGIAKYPGDDDHPPGPPFIFNARPHGSQGPYNLRLLIQPGPPGHILKVVDITKAHLTAPPPGPSSAPPPAVANTPPTPPTPAPPAASAPPSEPTADTPSGPIMDPGSASAPSTPSLAPPPDPAQAPH